MLVLLRARLKTLAGCPRPRGGDAIFVASAGPRASAIHLVRRITCILPGVGVHFICGYGLLGTHFAVGGSGGEGDGANAAGRRGPSGGRASCCMRAQALAGVSRDLVPQVEDAGLMLTHISETSALESLHTRARSHVAQLWCRVAVVFGSTDTPLEGLLCSLCPAVLALSGQCSSLRVLPRLCLFEKEMCFFMRRLGPKCLSCK